MENEFWIVCAVAWLSGWGYCKRADSRFSQEAGWALSITTLSELTHQRFCSAPAQPSCSNNTLPDVSHQLTTTDYAKEEGLIKVKMNFGTGLCCTSALVQNPPAEWAANTSSILRRTPDTKPVPKLDSIIMHCLYLSSLTKCFVVPQETFNLLAKLLHSAKKLYVPLTFRLPAEVLHFSMKLCIYVKKSFAPQETLCSTP